MGEHPDVPDLLDLMLTDALLDQFAAGQPLDVDDAGLSPLVTLTKVTQEPPLPEASAALRAAAAAGRRLGALADRRFALRSLAAAVAVVGVVCTGGISAAVTGDPLYPVRSIIEQISPTSPGERGKIPPHLVDVDDESTTAEAVQETLVDAEPRLYPTDDPATSVASPVSQADADDEVDDPAGVEGIGGQAVADGTSDSDSAPSTPDSAGTTVSTGSDGTASDGTASEGAGSEGAGSDGAGSEGAGSDGAGSDGAGSEGAASDGAASDGAGSDGAASDGAGSDGAASDGADSDGADSDGADSDGTTDSGAEGPGDENSESGDSATGGNASEGSTSDDGGIDSPGPEEPTLDPGLEVALADVSQGSESGADHDPPHEEAQGEIIVGAGGQPDATAGDAVDADTVEGDAENIDVDGVASVAGKLEPVG